ncbi:transient receptor potential cation channel subfamily a member 1-like [Gigaspora margarita]|uniref:Transient receptor potential cation channel subfamily a member 1-like n=1 Tax=Gigaspora margarita TaxID=4874 RepID=A0A8H3XD96_GIGMA|nr:transient receptor potential cation channel subfamily a member 1-like [Gigaspora margarita]
MSSSKSEGPLNDNQDQAKILIDDPNPHGGKKIVKYVLSPNMHYIATLSVEDESIVVWTITKELVVKYDNSLNANDLKIALNKFKKTFKSSESVSNLKFEDAFISRNFIGISNCKQVLLQSINIYGEFYYAIIDITTKLLQILKGYTIAFLENEDLVIVKKIPVYRAYIFSKSKSNGKHQWTCKNSIELKKFDNSYLFQNGKLLLILEMACTNYVVMQWDLITRKFDMQYILNWNIEATTIYLMKLNNDNTLLAVVVLDRSFRMVVYVYSTKSGFIVATKIFDERLHNFCFIGAGKEERLFFSGSHNETKNYNSYILNPHTHTLDKPPENHVLYDIYPVEYQNFKSIGFINIISDYIIKNETTHLSIQRLSQYGKWKNYTELKEHYYGNTYTYFNTKEIMRFMQTILEKYEKYESNQILTQNYPNEPELCHCEQCTWIIEYKKINENWRMQLKAQIESGKKIDVAFLSLKYGILEKEVLENGDIILITTYCILIYAINLEGNFAGTMIYRFDYWKKGSTPIQDIINLLTSFKNIINLNFYNLGFEILPFPTFQSYTKYKDLSLLKLYGTDIFHHLLRNNSKKAIDELLVYCYENSLLMFKNGDIYSFRLIISQIAFVLADLEQYNRTKRYTEQFLSKTNMLVGHIRTYYYHDESDDSLYFNFQHCGTYINSHYLFKTSFYNYIFCWISEKWNLLKKYPRFYKIFAFPYLLYSSYFTIYPQETVTLMFPLSNFATYPNNYSYSELLYIKDNSFTLLSDNLNYYKFWNVKALINFKWNTYGKFYYFIIWAIYSTFMGCFLIVVTIPENEISWINQLILLVATIFFGFIHFIFEIRQLIHRPMAYIKSPWNWFDLAAILCPIITCLIWLNDITPPIWLITISAFLLEFKFLLFFRALEYFGKYFAIMIGVGQKVFSFLLVLGIMVLAFAHSLHLLLRPTSEFSYDTPSYTNYANNPWNLVSTYKFISSNGTVGESSLIETPDDNTNLFSLFSTSLLAVYFMLTGDTSSVSSWNLKNNWILAFLLVIFSFFTTIYLLNLFISLLGMAVEETNNEESFLQLKGEVNILFNYNLK